MSDSDVVAHPAKLWRKMKQDTGLRYSALLGLDTRARVGIRRRK